MTDAPMQVPPSPPRAMVVEPAGERPKRKRGWIIAIAIVLVLAIAAWFGGEALARNIVTGVVKSKITSALGMDADHPIDLEISGAMIPQLISGSFTEVRVASDNVQLGRLEGDVSATARGMHFDGSADEVTATALLDPAQFIDFIEQDELREAITSLEVDGSELAVAATIDLFGAEVDVALNASVALGENNSIVVTPTTATVAGVELDLTDLTGMAASLLPDAVTDVLTGGFSMCLAEAIPDGVTLTDLSIAGERLKVDADIDTARILATGGKKSGTCS